ncbi:uncharacterized protein ARMOST_04966 [Armillaria ostoyae]|uniref:Uncharacterized protein n=1 Tax=Armillaria ostoyae TaxID=47428 RepID=A0A284QYU4_ARMOS|nr:uncharacterized protein ARMOST_04966 [Armillaria ostoyae]
MSYCCEYYREREFCLPAMKCLKGVLTTLCCSFSSQKRQKRFHRKSSGWKVPPGVPFILGFGVTFARARTLITRMEAQPP